MINDIVDNSILELRRGVVVMAALTILRKEGYGYSVLRQLAENGLEVDQGTLYPLLRRLESQGLLKSEWETSASKPRKYYIITEDGQIVLGKIKEHWSQFSKNIDELLEGK